MSELNGVSSIGSDFLSVPIKSTVNQVTLRTTKVDPLSMLENESDRSKLPRTTYRPEKFLANEFLFSNPDDKKYTSESYSARDDLDKFRSHLQAQLQEKKNFTSRLDEPRYQIKTKPIIEEVSPLQELYNQLDKIRITEPKVPIEAKSSVRKEYETFQSVQRTSPIHQEQKRHQLNAGKTIAELELEKYLVKQKEESRFGPAQLHVKLLGKEAMDHAENPSLISAAFHNLSFVANPAKSVVPNEHLAETLSNMLNDHDHMEKQSALNDHFQSVTNYHPHSEILEEIQRVNHNKREDSGSLQQIQIKSAIKNQQLLSRGSTPNNLRGVSFNSNNRVRIHGEDQQVNQTLDGQYEQQLPPNTVPELNASREESINNILNSPGNKSEQHRKSMVRTQSEGVLNPLTEITISLPDEAKKLKPNRAESAIQVRSRPLDAIRKNQQPQVHVPEMSSEVGVSQLYVPQTNVYSQKRAYNDYSNTMPKTLQTNSIFRKPTLSQSYRPRLKPAQAKPVIQINEAPKFTRMQSHHHYNIDPRDYLHDLKEKMQAKQEQLQELQRMKSHHYYNIDNGSKVTIQRPDTIYSVQATPAQVIHRPPVIEYVSETPHLEARRVSQRPQAEQQSKFKYLRRRGGQLPGRSLSPRGTFANSAVNILKNRSYSQQHHDSFDSNQFSRESPNNYNSHAYTTAQLPQNLNPDYSFQSTESKLKNQMGPQQTINVQNLNVVTDSESPALLAEVHQRMAELDNQLKTYGYSSNQPSARKIIPTKAPSIRIKGQAHRQAKETLENRRGRRDGSISKQLSEDPAAESSMLYHENMYYRDRGFMKYRRGDQGKSLK